ncbi:MAG: hypothetical protein SGILL_009841, partial [Bacillariaceae sp.]
EKEEEEQNPPPQTQTKPAAARDFKICRGDLYLIVPAPSTNHDSTKMKYIMKEANQSQVIKGLSKEEKRALRNREKELVVKIKDSGDSYGSDDFSDLTVARVLEQTDEDPVVLEISLQDVDSDDDGEIGF